LRAPTVPVGDGSWAPILQSWAEYAGAHHLYADGGNCFTHGGFPLRGSIIGANWLIMQEVLEPDEQASDFIQKTNQYPLPGKTPRSASHITADTISHI
jgi:hypothetical protein